jgi:trimeric autotransporter adhesin
MRFRILSNRKLPVFVFAVAFVLSFGFSGVNTVTAQEGVTASPAPRVVERVDESRLTRLPGNVPMLAKPQYDRGGVSPSTQLTHIRLVLKRSAEQEAALDKFQTELQDKSSSNYHKWLTPEQFGTLYGPADSDIAAIVAWLESHGLKLEEVSKGRTNIAFSGTASQVEEAFHTGIHSFEANGRQFYSNTSDPSIPSALAPVVSGVSHLNTIRPRPHQIAGPTGTIDHETKRLVTVAGTQSMGPRANLTVGSGTATDPYFLYIVPGDAATIYDTPNSTLNANYTGTSYIGSGVTIGIGGDAPIQASTVVSFRTKFLGNSTAPTITNVDGVTDTSDTDEAYIDTELSGGLAPGAAIHFYTSKDVTSAIVRAIDDNTVDIFSLSFGLCELELTTSDNAQIAMMWQQAFNQGIAVTVSTGDNGSASCDAVDTGNPTSAQYGLSVSGYASTPYNIAVGGTDLDGLNGTFSTYASTSQGSQATFYRTALQYIPESAWNDSSQTDTTIDANSPIPGFDQSGNPFANIVAGGGGFSNCSTSTNVAPGTDAGNCTSGYAKPAWQRGAAFLPDNARDLPDVSLMSGNGFDPATWLVCTDDPGTGSGGVIVTTNCTKQADGNSYFQGFGGTSTAAPSFAGILAIVEQKVGSRLGGDAAQVLYSLYNSSNASAIFHDTAIGNISVPCATSSPDCVTNTAGFPFESGYNASAGYDLATGMGSVDVKQLVNFWGSAVAPVTATLTVTPSATTILATQSLSVAVSVAGSGTTGTPTGTVNLSGGGYTSAQAALSSGAFTINIPAGSLAVGKDTLTVEYSGDSNYGSLSKTTSVTVTAPVASLSPATLAFANTLVGTTDPTTQPVTVTNTGTAPLNISGISLGGANASSFSQINNCSTTTALGPGASCTITVAFAPTAAGALTATIGIADNASGSPQTVSLSGTGEVPSFALTNSGKITVNPGATTGNTSTITVTPSGGFTGAVTLTCAISPTAASDPATCSFASASVTIGGAAAQTDVLTVSTTAATTAQNRPMNLFWPSAGGAALAMVFFIGIPARRRNWLSMLGLLVFFFSMAAIGCGGSSHSGGGNPGTTPGTYTVTVTGTAGSMTIPTTVTLTVN